MSSNQSYLLNSSQNQLKDDWASPVSDIRKRFLVDVMNRKHEASLSAIIQMLVTEEDNEIIPLALKAIGELGNKNAARLVQAFLYFSDIQIQLSALQTIDKLLENEDKLFLLLPFIDNLSEATESVYTDILSKYGSEKILEHLRQNIASNKSYIKQSSLRILKFLEGDSILQLLSTTVIDASRNIKLSTLEAISGRAEEPYNHMIHRLTQDPDIEVSEAALKLLSNSSSQPSFQRYKVDIFDKQVPTEQSEENFETEDQVQVNESEVKTNSNESSLVYQNISQIDESIDEHFLVLGQKVYSAMKSGISTHPQVSETIRKLEIALNKLQTQNTDDEKKGIVISVKKVFSGNLKTKMREYNRELAVEEAYIELGEQSFDLIVSQEWDFSENDSLIMRIQYLFQLRKEKISEGL